MRSDTPLTRSAPQILLPRYRKIAQGLPTLVRLSLLHKCSSACRGPQTQTTLGPVWDDAGAGALLTRWPEPGAFSLCRCVFPYYCPQGSIHPLGCPGGSEALNKSGLRVSSETSCSPCAAGTYRSAAVDILTCQPCPPGFICPQGECQERLDRDR